MGTSPNPTPTLSGEAAPNIRNADFETGNLSQLSVMGTGTSHRIVDLGAINSVLGRYVLRRSWTADTDLFSSFTDPWSTTSNEIWFRYTVRLNEIPLGSTGTKFLRFNSTNGTKTGLILHTPFQTPTTDVMSLYWYSEGAASGYAAQIGLFTDVPGAWWASSGHAPPIIRRAGTAFRITGHIQNGVNVGGPRTSALRARFWLDGLPVVHPDNTEGIVEQGFQGGWSVGGNRWLPPDGPGQPSWITSVGNSTATEFSSAELFDQVNATKSGNGSMDVGSLVISTRPLTP